VPPVAGRRWSTCLAGACIGNAPFFHFARTPMLIDARLLDQDATIVADICIVGTGMGAMSVAHTLVRAGRDVLFVEAGPLKAARRSHPAVQSENVGRPFGIAVSRGLEVGGGTAFWHGVCAPLDQEDFLARPWIPHSGWPIGHAELARWYPLARDFLGSQDGPDAATQRDSPAYPAPDVLDAKPYRYRVSPFRGKELLVEWCRHGRARCLYHATALQLLQAQGKARSLLVGSAGKRFRVIARRFVIAAGALETPRLLLNSLQQDNAPPASWWLGRNLIDHPAGYLSQVRFKQPFDEQSAEDASGLDTRTMAGFMLRGEVQRRHRLPNHAVFIRKGISKLPVPTAAMMSFLGMRGPRDVALNHLASLVRHPYIIWRIAHQKLPLRTRSRYGDLFFMTEQLPNPDSRVRLSAQARDEFGFPSAQVDWRLSAQDTAMFADYHALLMASLRKNDSVGGLRADPLSRWEETMTSAAHHLGTARMAATPRDGVVDRDAKVFGFENVWVGDGSVFPTAGSVNPSLTICALGHRLGAHLLQAAR